MLFNQNYRSNIKHKHDFEPEMQKKYLPHTCFQTRITEASLNTNIILNQKCTRNIYHSTKNLFNKQDFEPEIQEIFIEHTILKLKKMKQYYTHDFEPEMRKKSLPPNDSGLNLHKNH